MEARSELDTTKAELEATRAELTATRGELAAVRAELATLKGAAPAAVGLKADAAANPSAEAGLDVCVLPELSFLSPRGKFVAALSTETLTLTGKSSTIVVPLSTMRAWVLLDPTTKGVLFAATLRAPAANGKQSISCVTLASKAGEKPISLSVPQRVNPTGAEAPPIRAVPAEALGQALMRTVADLVVPTQPSPLQCFHKASEACLYISEQQCIVREGGKLYEMPHATTRAELLPPSGRRTFDIQFESREGAGACAAPVHKMELQMFPADEFAGVAFKLKKLGCNVNGCLDKAGGADDGGGGGKEEEEESGSEEDDDSDDEEDDDFMPDNDSEPEEEYNERGGMKVEGEEGAGAAGSGGGGDDDEGESSGGDSEGMADSEEGEEEQGDENSVPAPSVLGKRPLGK
jgi:hypothetical protein